MTLSDLLAALYDETGNSASPATAVTTRFTRYVNEGIRAVCAEPGLARLRDSDAPYTFATTANRYRYAVPHAVERLVIITERTNDRKLRAMDLMTYRNICPDPTAITGTPTHYVPIGRVSVDTQPADQSSLFVKSTSASDTNTSYLKGEQDGELFAQSVTMTGTTAANTTPTATLDSVTDWYLSAAAVGAVSLYEDSGTGTLLAHIQPGQTRPRYYGFYLYPTPSAAVTYYVDYRQELIDLSVANDEPPFPPHFHPMLVAYGLMREYERLADTTRMKVAAERFTYYLQRLKAYVNLPDEVLIPRGRGASGRSDLGAWYPAGTVWD